MTDQSTYDVAIVGYGPVGVTAANLLGQMGLKVVVVERDPNIYARARAISTDEEVVRIWQQIGLADRLNADMQPGNGANFVDADGVPDEVGHLPAGDPRRDLDHEHALVGDEQLRERDSVAQPERAQGPAVALLGADDRPGLGHAEAAHATSSTTSTTSTTSMTSSS